MAQTPEARKRGKDVIHLIPLASTDISSGDVVALSRANDPVSVSALGTAGRISPVAAAREGQWAVGVCDNKWTTGIAGATDYAAPDADNALRVERSGVFNLALVPTSGAVGDYVVYSSGASGAQLFTIDNSRPGYAIGRIAKAFSGATANDLQEVELVTHDLGAANLVHWLENRVLTGCIVHQHSAAAARSQNVAVGYSSTTAGQDSNNVVLIQNQVYSLASDFTLDIGDCSVAGQSAAQFRWVVARSGAFASRTASGIHSAFASYTATGISAGMMVPTTMTAGEVPIALVINFSNPQSYTNGLLHNLRTPNLIPRVGSWGI